jgi:hypothetical protein
MSDAANDAELGRSKQSTSPADHLLHLLNLGWSPTSPLIVKYVQEHRLTKELNDWQAIASQATPGKGRSK